MSQPQEGHIMQSMYLSILWPEPKQNKKKPNRKPTQTLKLKAFPQKLTFLVT